MKYNRSIHHKIQLTDDGPFFIELEKSESRYTDVERFRYEHENIRITFIKFTIDE